MQSNRFELTGYLAAAPQSRSLPSGTPVALTFEKGDNIHVIGTIQQRQFTPKDGSTRIVYEVVVQKCHRIARLGVAQHIPADPATEQSLQTATEEAPGDAQGEVDAWAVL